MVRVCILVPTHASRSYFERSFVHLSRAAAALKQAHETLVVAVINGGDPADEAAVRDTISASPVPAEMICVQQKGKNGAINVGLEFCRRRGFDIVQIVDDDQIYEPDALVTNVEMLLNLREQLGLEGLVGSRHIATGGNRSWLGWIASLAFEGNQEAPRFCIGGSMCAFVSSFPKLPADETGIADDAFVCNFFYVRYRELYKATGIMPIMFPERSRVYFNVSGKYQEYQRQQVRIRYGVLASYRAFPELQDELRAYFSWKFHCDDDAQNKPSPIAELGNLVRWWIFRWMRRKANAQAEARLAAGIKGVPWNTAASTKLAAGAEGR